ncbi:MAG: hypothetical protein NUV51_09310 [Sulfuricaulis sp.]|nr:hypothetical protein [Sulfuricaulis sp.]
MTLLDALAAGVKDIGVRRRGVDARLVHFAFTEEESAYLSEIDLDELVPMLEDWCRQRRTEMGTVQ